MLVQLFILLGPDPAGAQAPGPAPPTLRKPQFVRGDSNGDGAVDLSDAIHGLNYLFGSGPPVRCLAATDSNGDEAVDVSDAVYTLLYLFLGSEPPPAPGPRECGVDPRDGGLGCDSYARCPDDSPLIAHVLNRITFGATEDFYRAIQTRKDLEAYMNEQLLAPDGYDPRVHEPALFDRVERLGIGFGKGGNAAEQVLRLKASVLVYALGSRWQLLQVITEFWENHFHTQVDALRENFFQRGGRGGAALNATQQIFDLADADKDGLISMAEWNGFQAVHPGLADWSELGRSTLDGSLTPAEFLGAQQIAYWKYDRGPNQYGVAGEMERRENEFFRRRALGRFHDVIEGSAKGVPMLLYLNGFENTAAAPNENYAREIHELFGLGVDRVYTQRDIQELAKLLTGWSVSWVERAQFNPATDPQLTGHPEARTFPLNLREPRPVAAPTRQFWDDALYTWAFTIDLADHDWGRKDLYLQQYGGTDSLGNPVGAADRLQVPANTTNRTVAAALGEFDQFLDRLIAFRDCRKFIVTKLIQLLVTDDLGQLSKSGPAPPDVLAMFQAADLDKSGAIERSEWEKPIPLVLPNGRPPEVFLSLDRNGDGKLTLEEYREPDLLLGAMARWQETGGDIREVLRTILFSEEFLSLKFQNSKVKTPLEQLTSTARVLNATLNDVQLKTGAGELSLAGMDLFQFGDPTGESELGLDWMNTISVLERIKWISRGANPEVPSQRRFDWSPSSFVSRYRLAGRDQIAGFFIQLLHPEGILANDRALALKTYDEAPSSKVEAMVTFLLSIPCAFEQ